MAPDFLAAEIPTITVLLQQQAPDACENYSAPPKSNLGGKIDAALRPLNGTESRDSIHACNVKTGTALPAKNPVAGTSPDLEEFCAFPQSSTGAHARAPPGDDLLDSMGLTRNIAMRLTNSELVRTCSPPRTW